MLAEQDRIKKLLNELLNPGFYNVITDEFRAKVICDWHKKKLDLKGQKVTIQVPQIEHISNILKELKIMLLSSDMVRGGYVHGSFANGTNVDSSDLDLTITLENIRSHSELIKLRDRIKGIDLLLHSVDPLCHHGPYFLTEKMLSNYLECYLPLDVWRNSKCLIGPQEIEFNVVKSELHDKAEFERSVKYYNKEHDLSTEYLKKRFACMANMIPCVVYPWKTGKYTTKYEATKWMVNEYPFTRVWVADMELRRQIGIYKRVDFLKQETRTICNRIKEMG